MKLEDILELSDEELQHEMADLDGKGLVFRARKGAPLLYMSDSGEGLIKRPDYIKDLNAMHDIEDLILKGKFSWGGNPHNILEWADYYKALMKVTGTAVSYFAGKKILHATAKQKAMAFIIAMTENH